MDIEQMKKEIEQLKQENENTTNQLKKALADYINLERDMELRIERRSLQLKLALAHKLLKSLDDMTSAITASKELKVQGSVKQWIEGVLGIFSEVEKSLLELGISPMTVNVGDIFDSSMHEALSALKGEKDNTILEVIQKGYVLGDVVVRPARVVVVKNQ